METRRCHYWPGTRIANRTAIVLACPGRLERRDKIPAAGVTGSNLNKLLTHLAAEHPQLFRSIDRYDYVITNASATVHYKGLTGDTVPGITEITEPANLRRFRDEIMGCSTILALGACAGHIVTAAFQRGDNRRIIRSNWHLSLQCLNRNIREDVDGNAIIRGQAGATDLRVAVVARDILSRNPRQLSPKG